MCSLNEFRSSLGLPRELLVHVLVLEMSSEYLDVSLAFSSFLDWNANQQIADDAEKLYGHIDNLELYPGK